MTFNIEKCKVLHLGSNNHNHQFTIPMSGEEVHTLEVTIDEKDLGVTIDKQIQISMHVQTQVAKANRISTISVYTRWNCLATTDASKSRSPTILTVHCLFQRVSASGQSDAAELICYMITKLQ